MRNITLIASLAALLLASQSALALGPSTGSPTTKQVSTVTKTTPTRMCEILGPNGEPQIVPCPDAPISYNNFDPIIATVSKLPVTGTTR
jgi:hypothetical protein